MPFRRVYVNLFRLFGEFPRLFRNLTETFQFEEFSRLRKEREISSYTLKILCAPKALNVIEAGDDFQIDAIKFQKLRQAAHQRT